MTSAHPPDQEEIPVIDPGKISVPADPKQTESAAGSRFITNSTLAVIFAILVVIAVGVIFFLPEAVDKKLSERDANNQISKTGEAPALNKPDPLTPQPAATGFERINLEKDREEAEAALAQFLIKQKNLETKAVSLWGGDQYAKVIEVAEVGDQALRNKAFDSAALSYSEGLQILDALEKALPEHLQDALKAGETALQTGDAQAAREQFTLASKMDSDSDIAHRGLQRAGINKSVFALLNASRDYEERQVLDQAKKKITKAIELDPDIEMVKQVSARINTKLSEQDFRSAMSEGFQALGANQYASALKAFQKARSIKFNAEEVSEAIAQAQEGLRLEKISFHRNRAAELEQEERWHGAADHYAAVLSIDSSVQFARQGKKRSLKHAKIHKQLDSLLKEPTRLFSKGPYTKTQKLLATVQALPIKAPKLSEKIAKLEKHLKLAGTPFVVNLISDKMTDVAVYKVGKFGKISARKLMLRPGTYTAVGTRSGYRDVRQEFTVDGSQKEIPVEIICKEKI